MTECEKVICKMYLEDMRDNCNENRLLLQMLEAEPCEDAISRQATIAEICRYECERKHDECALHEGHCRLIKTLEEMPTVHAVPKTGHWIDEGWYADGHSEHSFRCSECGGHIIEFRPDDYCKFCGAKMEE